MTSLASASPDTLLQINLAEDWFRQALKTFIDNNPEMTKDEEHTVRIITAGLTMFFTSWVGTYVAPSSRDLFFQAIKEAISKYDLLHATPAGQA